MAKQHHTSAWPPVLFFLNMCVLAPLGFVVNEHIKDHRNFKDRVLIEFQATNRKTGETRELLIQNTATNEAQTKSLEHHRARLDKLEQRYHDAHQCP